MDVGTDHRARAVPASARTGPRRRRAAAGREHALDYPSGWFALALSSELARGAVLRRRLAGEDVVLYRTRSGSAHAVRPHCPHLGAHLGHGGKVEGEDLVCPFHRFAFAPDGSCAGAPDGAVIRGRLEHHPVAESDGFVFAWHGGDGTPGFEPPRSLGADLAPTSCWTTRLRAHVQDVSENLVDYRHLSALHGLRSAEPLVVEPDGHRLHTQMRMSVADRRWARPFTGSEISSWLEGLGCLRTKIRVSRPRLTLHLWITATPVDPGRTRVRVAFACMIGGRRVTLANKVLAWIFLRLAVKVVREDVPIWNHQRHLDHPHLTHGDEGIGVYRRWARRFYAPAPDSAADA
ncbi:Rieske 2Fe-2S domain-containing protein [Actinomadura graeca]|uniref:Rieske-type oxygenase n=1 Tax=Actinomadura graeca TaxID=2750812 RepID=A0ABX8R3G9_9ACTN|nr:Rieske 2Fe-2S domain-containing protein [Actinomadura graeca]QXJ24994.1 Rieske 2Fe-2S domain-containing protein [Actinomadura graeca]